MGKLVQIHAPNAPSGSAYFYAHGTSSPATVFSDFDLNEPIGSRTALNSDGFAQVYVNNLTDVTVKKADGTVVQSFTASDGDISTIVRSSAFTGTTQDGQQEPGGAVDLRTVLDRILRSFGTTDMLVQPAWAEEPMLLVDALLPQYEPPPATSHDFFNVKDYGATGDGETDDTTAILAAIAAAEVAGGIVFFPAGTYLCAGELIVSSDKVYLLGVSPTASVLTYSGTGTFLTFAGSGISNLAISSTVTLTDVGSTPVWPEGQMAPAVGVSASGVNGVPLHNVAVTGFRTLVSSSSTVHISGGRYYQSLAGYSGATPQFAISITGVGSTIVGASVTGFTTSGDAENTCSVIRVSGNDQRIALCTITMGGFYLDAGVLIDASVDGTVVAGNCFTHVNQCGFNSVRILKVGNGRVFETLNYGRLVGGTLGEELAPALVTQDALGLQQHSGSPNGKESMATVAANASPPTCYIDGTARFNYIAVTSGTGGIAMGVRSDYRDSRATAQEVFVIINNATGTSINVTYTAEYERAGTTDTVTAGSTLKLHLAYLNTTYGYRYVTIAKT